MQSIAKLKMGPIEAALPIIQGGMGIRVSGHRLAAAVANEGGVGIISTVGLGDYEGTSRRMDALDANVSGLTAEIEKARNLSSGIVGVNIMAVLSHYAELAQASVRAGVDVIISGAGLPLDLPKYVGDAKIALIPIVSSVRALKIVCGKWRRSYGRLPDAVVVEGPKAGGHLGFKFDDLTENSAQSLESIVSEVVDYCSSFDEPIPVIAAGGIFDGADIMRFLEIGASGVQMATRFVCTDECDVDRRFKQAYVDATEDDLIIIKSPVGLPGRVIRNAFVDRVIDGVNLPFTCRYKCLRTCDPATSPYCIADVLTRAARGEMDEAFCFAGSNAYRCTEIVSVKELFRQLLDEMNNYNAGSSVSTSHSK